jgi:hypothetical protein
MYNIKNLIKYYLLPENSKKLLSLMCFFFGICSVCLSIFLIIIPISNSTENFNFKLFSLFIGLWAPTLISIANYLKD